MSSEPFLIGSHVSMNGKEMFLGSAKKRHRLAKLSSWFIRVRHKIPLESRLRS